MRGLSLSCILLVAGCATDPAGDGDVDGGGDAARPTGVGIVKAAMSEYKSGFLNADGTLSSFYYNGQHVEMAPFKVGERKIVDAAPGFNVMLMLDDAGFVWLSAGGSDVPTRYETDKTGAPFDGNTSIYGYFSTFTSIRSDGSIWYWGDDTYRLFGADAMHPITQPVPLSAPGIRFKKVAMGRSIVALTEAGEVYAWGQGNVTPVKKVTPRAAIDVFASHYDYNGCVIPDAVGDAAGWPYVWGSEFGFWGGDKPYAEPTSVQALWQMTAPVVKIAASQNTIHYIDTMGRLFGIGDNACGEIGNGEELVNHAERYPTPYAWSWAKGEAFTGAPPIEVGKGTRWKDVWKGNAFSFYSMASDELGNLYSWGRQKSFVLGNGYANDQEDKYPNALDVLVPTLVDPYHSPAQYYAFKMYTLDAGADQNVTGTSTMLSGTGTPTTLTATGTPANGKPKIGYEVKSFGWTQKSGPPGATIVAPAMPMTMVTGLVPGTYVFRLLMVDDNTASIADDVTVTVAP